MTVAANKLLSETPPEEALRASLEDPAVRSRLGNQANALLLRQGTAFGIEIDDLVQETLKRAVEGQKRFDSSRPAGAWLHGMLVNVVREKLRDHHRLPSQQPVDSDRWAEAAVVPPSSTLDIAAVRGEAERYLSQLSPDDRDIVRMRFFDELTLKDIAVKLKMTPAAARMRFSRAMRRLQEMARASPEGRP
jgi:RNA polymerase sigma factor (sigma-70 family)